MSESRIESKTTHSFSPKNIEDLLLKALNLTRSSEIKFEFGIDKGTDGRSFCDEYRPAGLTEVRLIITKVSKVEAPF